MIGPIGSPFVSRRSYSQPNCCEGIGFFCANAAMGGYNLLELVRIFEIPKYLAVKELQFNPSSWQSTAHKVAKWATLGFAALAGTALVACYGASVGLVFLAVTFLQCPEIAIGMALTTSVIAEIVLIVRIAQLSHVFLHLKPDSNALTALAKA